MPPKKKLIEVALPLEAINKASAREKSIWHGHPSTLHLWWARRPLAAARAVIFAQMVDDPSAHPDLFPTEKPQEKERQRLFRIIEDLVLWENTTNETVLQRTRDEIWQSWRYTCAGERKEIEARREELEEGEYARLLGLFDPERLPAFHDPFAGGGALPLEAQRLGLESYAYDLNPVAVLINKAMIEIPPRFAGRAPVHPDARRESGGVRSEGRPSRSSLLFPLSYKGAQGLAEDVRYYGRWMRDEAEKRIGRIYPKVTAWRDPRSGRHFGDSDVAEWKSSEERGVRSESGEQAARDCGHPSLSSLLSTLFSHQLTVIAWLWARTVKSPNTAFANVDVPLASTFILSTKAGKEAYVEPVIEGGGYRFTAKVGKPKDAEGAKNGTKLARANFVCLLSGAPVSSDYIKAEGKAGRMGARLMAIVAERDRGRVYLAPTPEMEAIALTAQTTWKPEGDIPTRMTGGNCTPYGLTTWGDLFTRRQVVVALKAELPQALRLLQGLPTKELSPHSSFLFFRTGIAPVDLAQAAIGPGMAVYTRYAKVVEAETGNPLTVRAALALINQTLDEALAEQEGDFDADSRWALTWFEQTGFAEGDYGVAEQLSKSKNTSVSGLAEAGILVSRAGKVRLLKPAELPADWDPATDNRLTVWEMVHHLVRVLETGGEDAAAALVAKLGSQAETARELCYRLYVLSERKKRANEAMAYNALVQSWPEITRLARETPRAAPLSTADMFDEG